MNQEKFGKLIKEIRYENNLTQKQLAEKYNVTCQAVSKWENGINMPDTFLIKKISEDFGLSLEGLLNGEQIKLKKTNKIYPYITIIAILLLVMALTIFFVIKSDDFSFKTLSTSCEDFNISGNIAYNDNKSAIYITNIKYCGNDISKKYKNIECVLYEKDGDIEKRISSYKYEDSTQISLEEFLEDVTLSIDNYEKNCKEYSKINLYLSINAEDESEIITTYTIPLKMEDDCTK